MQSNYGTECSLNSSSTARCSALAAKPLRGRRAGPVSGAFLGHCLWQTSTHNRGCLGNLLLQDLEVRGVVRQGESLDWLLLRCLRLFLEVLQQLPGLSLPVRELGELCFRYCADLRVEELLLAFKGCSFIIGRFRADTTPNP